MGMGHKKVNIETVVLAAFYIKAYRLLFQWSHLEISKESQPFFVLLFSALPVGNLRNTTVLRDIVPAAQDQSFARGQEGKWKEPLTENKVQILYVGADPKKDRADRTACQAWSQRKSRKDKAGGLRAGVSWEGCLAIFRTPPCCKCKAQFWDVGNVAKPISCLALFAKPSREGIVWSEPDYGDGNHGGAVCSCWR